MLIAVFNSIILLSCCYLEVQSSLGKLSETVSRTGLSVALLLQLRIQPNTRFSHLNGTWIPESFCWLQPCASVPAIHVSPWPPCWVGSQGQPLARPWPWLGTAGLPRPWSCPQGRALCLQPEISLPARTWLPGDSPQPSSRCKHLCFSCMFISRQQSDFSLPPLPLNERNKSPATAASAWGGL